MATNCAEGQKLDVDNKCVPDCGENEVIRDGECISKCRAGEETETGACIPVHGEAMNGDEPSEFGAGAGRHAAAKAELKAEPKAGPKTKPKDETPTEECILDPAKCKAGSNTDTSPPDPVAGNFYLADVKAGTDPTKAIAHLKCADKAAGGETVKIKISIAGPTGTVISASPEDDSGNAILGQCVADELQKSTFRKVSRKNPITTVIRLNF